MQEKITRLRQLMADAVPRPKPKSLPEEDAWARFDYYASNAPEHAALDDSDRARAVRDINRVAIWYGMQTALTNWLDIRRASGIAALSDEQVFELQLHLRQLEDCVQSGFDSPFTPPAS